MSKKHDETNNNEYGGEQIKVLKGLEPVRKRPGMYIGSTDQRGLHHLIWEIVDNAVDEALAGHCTEITVEIDDKNVVTVTDNGRGVPTGIHPGEKIPVIDVLFTMLHAGGKFGGEESGYKVSGGLHGVGASVTNALSEWLHVEVRRDNEIWQAQYKDGGKPSKKTQRVGAMKKTDLRGTTVSWFADQIIFKDGIKYDYSTIEQRLREKAFLVRGLKFVLKFQGHEDKIFLSKKGIAEMVEILNREREAIAPVIFLSSDTYENEDFETDVPVELAMQWTKSSDERIFSYANVVSTTDGGTHVSGLSAAITACLNKFAWDSNKLKKDKKQSFDRRDIFDGLTAAIAVKIEDPQFEGQTKGKLNNPEARTAAQTFVYAALTDWLNDKANQRTAKAILDRCLLSREIRIAKNNASKKIRNQATSIFADSNLPGKLADCLDVRPVEEREIFICEGDSAAGCFSGETKIRLVSGIEKTFVELTEDWTNGITHFGYATNDSGDIRIVPLIEPRVTKSTSDLVIVELDNGEKITCTSDHKFRLRNGEYCRADNLKSGESIMPLKVKYTDKKEAIGSGYEMVWMNGAQKWNHSHHLADYYNLVNKIDRKTDGIHRHHIDFNKQNNDPRNIKRLHPEDHLKIHQDQWGKTLAGLWDDPIYRKNKIESASKSAIKQWQDDEYKEYMRNIFIERRKDPVMNKKVMDGFKKWFANLSSQEHNDYCQAMWERQNEYWSSEENRQAQSKRVSEYFANNPDARAAHSEKAIQQWDDESLRKWRSEKTKEQMSDTAMRLNNQQKTAEWWKIIPITK